MKVNYSYHGSLKTIDLVENDSNFEVFYYNHFGDKWRKIEGFYDDINKQSKYTVIALLEFEE